MSFHTSLEDLEEDRAEGRTRVTNVQLAPAAAARRVYWFGRGLLEGCLLGLFFSSRLPEQPLCRLRDRRLVASDSMLFKRVAPDAII